MVITQTNTGLMHKNCPNSLLKQKMQTLNHVQCLLKQTLNQVHCFLEINPEPSSLFSETNPESCSTNPEPHSVNPEPRSAESSLIIKKHKDTDAKIASLKQQTPKNQNHLPFRNSLIAFFVERTGISGPPRDFKVANRLWTTPIYRIGELVDFDIQKGQDLISLSLARLKGLTVANPNSILKTAQSIAGEQKIYAVAHQFREEIY